VVDEVFVGCGLCVGLGMFVGDEVFVSDEVFVGQGLGEWFISYLN
jgi:hypothetical protein